MQSGTEQSGEFTEPSPYRGLAVAAAIFSFLLPLYILILKTPISGPDLDLVARMHLRPDFWPRAALTFIYFPAVLFLHFWTQPRGGRLQFLYLFGFFLFLTGNAIDLAFRGVQYLVLHGQWAPELLRATDPSVAVAAREKMKIFAELAPSISFCFSIMFAAGRCVMGSALWLVRKPIVRIAGVALILNGLWNLATVLSQIPALSFLGALGSLYLWPWLLSIAMLGLLAVRAERI